jgi:hypothetical protein
MYTFVEQPRHSTGLEDPAVQSAGLLRLVTVQAAIIVVLCCGLLSAAVSLLTRDVRPALPQSPAAADAQLW